MNTLQAAADRLAQLRRQLGGDPGPVTRCAALDELTAIAAMLERSGRRRLRTDALAARVATLEAQLAHLDPGERREAICARLGLGRTRYYELRRVRNSPDWNLL